MIVKINHKEIETNDIFIIKVLNYVAGSTENQGFLLEITDRIKNHQFHISLSNLDIDETILNDDNEFRKYTAEFRTRLFRDITELLFSDDPFLENKINLQARAEFINEMIHNAL